MGAAGAASATPEKLTVPSAANMPPIARSRPMSPTRFMTNAFFDATAYSGTWFQKPMSR